MSEWLFLVDRLLCWSYQCGRSLPSSPRCLQFNDDNTSPPVRSVAGPGRFSRRSRIWPVRFDRQGAQPPWLRHGHQPNDHCWRPGPHPCRSGQPRAWRIKPALPLNQKAGWEIALWWFESGLMGELVWLRSLRLYFWDRLRWLWTKPCLWYGDEGGRDWWKEFEARPVHSGEKGGWIYPPVGWSLAMTNGHDNKSTS